MSTINYILQRAGAEQSSVKREKGMGHRAQVTGQKVWSDRAKKRPGKWENGRTGESVLQKSNRNILFGCVFKMERFQTTSNHIKQYRTVSHDIEQYQTISNDFEKYKLSCLPRKGIFNSGICPGAAAITRNFSLYSNLWATVRGEKVHPKYLNNPVTGCISNKLMGHKDWEGLPM